MDYSLALVLIFCILGLSLFIISLLLGLKKRKKLQKLQNMPFDDKYRKFLLKTPHYKNLDEQDREKIEKSIILFIYTKEFVGVGIEATDEIKVIIAFYACLLLLHLDTESCYENLQTIIIYPVSVVTDKISSSGGVYTKEKFVLDGQSANNTVVITWHDAKKEAYHLRHDNVIIHEFAHEIDFMDGEIDGIPPIEKSKYNEWTNILFKDYKKLNEIAMKNREWGKYKLLGSYAATNEAEFFAVATERFFETPKSLKKSFPQLYNELESYYNIDTIRLIED
jgi:Mlc titration factor MtfA (ptsG expression regulator)